MKEAPDRTAWFQGKAAVCATIPDRPKRVHRLVLLGAPGSGKGTQAELLHKQLGACHLSTGDLFRAAKQSDSHHLTGELKQALEFMRRGELVPDRTVLALVRERSRCLQCPGGFLLDGFPRTVAQADALEDLLAREHTALTAVVNYDLPADKVIARLSGRRTCSVCKATFHVSSAPPSVDGVCDHCGAVLFQREDDRPESIRVRMRAYEQTASPLLEYYRRRGLLINVDADAPPEEICRRGLAALQPANGIPAA